MRKRIAFIMATACVLLMAGCGVSNSAEDPSGADSQMAENAGQTDTEENIDDAASSSETQKPAKEEDWENKALLDEYAAYGLGGMEAAEYSDTNAEELADTFGILISLPENTTWIADSEYYLIDENNLRISYHDSVADADCTLLVSKNNNLNLPQAEYDETLNETWEGFTIGSQHIVVKVQHENNDEKIVLATWEYNEYQFAIISEDVNDSTPIPKVALYIINRLD